MYQNNKKNPFLNRMFLTLKKNILYFKEYGYFQK